MKYIILMVIVALNSDLSFQNGHHRRKFSRSVEEKQSEESSSNPTYSFSGLDLVACPDGNCQKIDEFSIKQNQYEHIKCSQRYLEITFKDNKNESKIGFLSEGRVNRVNNYQEILSPCKMVKKFILNDNEGLLVYGNHLFYVNLTLSSFDEELVDRLYDLWCFYTMTLVYLDIYNEHDGKIMKYKLTKDFAFYLIVAHYIYSFSQWIYKILKKLACLLGDEGDEIRRAIVRKREDENKDVKLESKTENEGKCSNENNSSNENKSNNEAKCSNTRSKCSHKKCD